MEDTTTIYDSKTGYCLGDDKPHMKMRRQLARYAEYYDDIPPGGDEVMFVKGEYQIQVAEDGITFWRSHLQPFRCTTVRCVARW